MIRSGSDRLLYWVLGIGLLLSYAYLYQGGGWNQNSRFALVRAMLERDTLQIDAYREATGDRAVWKGHFYSDKAPGASLLSFVPVDLVRALNNAIGVDPDSDVAITRTSYTATVVVSGLFTAAAALCVLWLSLAWGYFAGSGALRRDGVRRRHAGVVLRDPVHGARALRRLPDDRVHRGRRPA